MNAWVIFVRNFASKNKMSYGCAMTDPRCKSEYQAIKKKSARNPVSFVPKTKTQKPIKKVFKAKEEPKEEPKKEMPEELSKVIQDFARPLPIPKTIGLFTTNYDDYYAIMDDGSILSLLKRSKKPVLFRKEESVEDAWKWLKKNVPGLEYYNYTYNMLTDDTLIKKYGLKIGNPSTETKMLFYIKSAGETLARKLAEFDTPEAIEMRKIERERLDREQEEKKQAQKERWRLQAIEEEKAEKEKKRLKKIENERRKQLKAEPKPKGRQTFTKKLKLIDSWSYTFGRDEEEDDDFMSNFENNVKTYYLLEEMRKDEETAFGNTYEDEKGKFIYTIENDNYMYEPILEAVWTDGDFEDEVFEEQTFDKPNEFNKSIDLLELKQYKLRQAEEKKQKVERESMGVEDNLSKQAEKKAEKERDRERKRLKK